MRSPSLFAVTGAVLAAALLSQGCRTLNRSRDRVTADDIPFESVDQPSRIARSTAPAAVEPVETVPATVAPAVAEPDVETPSVAEPVAPAPVARPAAKPVYREPVVAERPAMDTTPYEVRVVKSADEVGKPGSYVEQVIPEGGEAPASVEVGGLRGSTGRHVSLPAPKPEPVPVVKPAPAGSGVYVVQPGDILGRIALKHGVSRQAILDANPSIKDPNKLKVGQKLKIPPRGTGITDKPKAKRSAESAAAKPKKALPAKDGYTVYTVKKGDILGRIAIAHKTTTKAILEANGLANADRIREGQQLYVPVAGAAAPEAEAPAPKAGAKPAPKGKSVKVVEKPAAEAPATGDKSTDEMLRELGIGL